ncbi:hypothetical protein MNF40_004534 [Vibrio parahaemolyticus]|nr:hypothetical protein [Vibrio parahaemolyticus]
MKRQKMKLKFNFICFLPLLMVMILISSCSSVKKMPVSIENGFMLSSLLSDNIEIGNVNDVSKLIKGKWYTDILVRGLDSKVISFSSCDDYFNFPVYETKLINEYDVNAYLELRVMCDAANLLRLAKPSKYTYLFPPILNVDTPDVWPKQVSFFTSSMESKRNNQNSDLKYWSDVTSIISVKKNSEFSATYYHSSGYQEVDIVGKGDLNDDDVEDLIVVIRDHVRDGSYFNIRLLVLSVDRNQKWSLLSEY